ncbi:hypothetical protein DS893_02570 [Vibrionales bacterium C3R12]|nr:hypothetical protein DS893_02570 [Vibrionales bacterium C3R12]
MVDKLSSEVIIESSNKIVANLELIFAGISSLAALAAVSVVIVALFNWKKVERFKHTFALEDSFLELFDAYQMYLRSVHQYELLKLSTNELVEKYESYKDNVSSAKFDTDVAYRNYAHCYDRLTRLNKNLPNGLSPQSIHNQFASAAASINKAIKANEMETFPREELEAIWNKTKKLLSSLG